MAGWRWVVVGVPWWCWLWSVVYGLFMFVGGGRWRVVGGTWLRSVVVDGVRWWCLCGGCWWRVVVGGGVLRLYVASGGCQGRVADGPCSPCVARIGSGVSRCDRVGYGWPWLAVVGCGLACGAAADGGCV